MIIVLSAMAGALVGAIGARSLPDHDPSPFAHATVPGSEATRPPTATVLQLAGAGAVLFTVLAMLIGASTVLPAWLALAGFGLALAVIDGYHHRLPNRLVAPALLVGVLLLAAHGMLAGDPASVARALAGSVALFAFYLVLALISPSQLGMGDVKLAAVIGLYLGWLGWGPWVLGAAAGPAIGAVASAAVLIRARLARQKGRAGSVAFGPSMLAGVLAVVLLQV